MERSRHVQLTAIVAISAGAGLINIHVFTTWDGAGGGVPPPVTASLRGSGGALIAPPVASAKVWGEAPACSRFFFCVYLAWNSV